IKLRPYRVVKKGLFRGHTDQLSTVGSGSLNGISPNYAPYWCKFPSVAIFRQLRMLNLTLVNALKLSSKSERFPHPNGRCFRGSDQTVSCCDQQTRGC